jgi:YD repeat-containing protein
MKKFFLLMTSCALAVPSTASAQQVQTFTYDVHGRLTATTRTTDSSSQTTTYALDKADNRTTRSVGAVTTGLLAADNALEAAEEQAAQQPAPSPAGEESETSAEPDLGANQ